MSKQRRRSYRDFADMSGFEIELPSSPDPLGDEDPTDSAPVPPSTTRRLLQSTASSRFSARPGTSPRKRMFALDVGNEIAPQTIYVTVEAGQDGNPVTRAPAVGSSVRRRLFGSPTPQPSPQRRVRTTTTIVPLRGLTDDEGDPTPRRRRRSSVGRPNPHAASSAKKKKRGTPTPKASKKSRGSQGPSSDVDIIQADTPAATPKRRGRPPKRSLPEDLLEQDNPNTTQTLPRKKGGRRREALGPDDMDRPLNENDTEPVSRDDGVTSQGNDNASEELVTDTALEDGWVAVQAEEEGDLWMENMSDPLAQNDEMEAERDHGAQVSKPVNAPLDAHAGSELEDQGALLGESDDYAPMMDNDDRSDVESRHSEPSPHAERNHNELEDQGPLPGESDDYSHNTYQDDRSNADDYAPIAEQDDQSDVDSQRSEQPGDFRDPAAFRDELDHTVDPESFTMIGLESMLSFRASRNVGTSDPAELGEDTSLFINKTLDSLRQEIAESDEDEVDVLISRGQTPAESEPETQAPASLSAPIRFQKSGSPVKRSSRQGSRSPGRAQSAAGSASRRAPHEHTGAATPNVSNAAVKSTRYRRNEPTDDEDSFSDIPEEVLAAAESDEHLHHELLGPTQREVSWHASFNDGSNHSDASTVQDHALGQDTHATPSDPNRYQVVPDPDFSQQSATRSAQSRRSNQPMERDSPPQSLRSRTDSNRLLTPDATTSSSTQSPPAQQDDIEEDERPVASDDVGSSPPDITTFIEPNEGIAMPRRESDTRANPGPEIHVDHVQERPTFAAVLQPTLLGGTRPTLSPVVRIGRTLQNILSDPPSPSGASSVLGSPFKGSVRYSSPMEGAAVDEASPNATASDDTPRANPTQPVPQVAEAAVQSPEKSWAMSMAPLSQIKKLVTQGAQLFTSPHVDISQDMEDPFAPSSPTLDKTLDNTRNSAFMDRIRQASREGSRPSSRIGGRAALCDETKLPRANPLLPAPPSGAMGFNMPTTALSVGSQTSQRGQRQVASTEHDIVHDEDADELGMDEAERSRVDEHPSNRIIPRKPGDDSAEEDNSKVEEQQQMRRQALTSTMRHPKPHEPGSSTDEDDMEIHERQRAVGCPSTSNLQRYRSTRSDSGVEGVDEDHMEANEYVIHVDDAPVGNTPAEDEEDEDIWAIEADRTASSPQYPASQHDTSNLFRKSELSVDWGTRSTNSQGTAHPNRSPAFNSRRNFRELPPEDLEDYSLVDLHSGTPAQPSAQKPPADEQTEQKSKLDLSDFFSSSPNFIERQRRAKEASLAKSAAQSAAVASSQLAYPNLSGQDKDAELSPTKSPSTADGPTIEIPPAAGGTSQDTRESTARTSSSATPEQARHRVHAKRMTPRGVQNDAALFESWSVSSRAPMERPPTSEASSTPRAVTPLERESSIFESPDLRPLPSRAASPAKSCLRSPLKARTPGRSVEFTSSTMSEIAPLQALANSQKNASAASDCSALLHEPLFPGKENQTAQISVHDTTIIRASSPRKPIALTQLPQPQTQQQQQESNDFSLSQTRWSRNHWLYLDGLWKEYQHSPREFQRQHIGALTASPGRRPSSSLLGKVVSNQGETVALLQSHLDVVDAFKHKVGGWHEESLAKRLFALIVGAERRRLGLVPKRR